MENAAGPTPNSPFAICHLPFSIHNQGPEYWRSLEELAGSPAFQAFVQREFPLAAAEWHDAVSRRRFLQLMGASLALAGLAACSRQPDEKIVPYVRVPREAIIPGQPLYFATTMALGGLGLGELGRIGKPVLGEIGQRVGRLRYLRRRRIGAGLDVGPLDELGKHLAAELEQPQQVEAQFLRIHYSVGCGRLFLGPTVVLLHRSDRFLARASLYLSQAKVLRHLLGYCHLDVWITFGYPAWHADRVAQGFLGRTIAERA